MTLRLYIFEELLLCVLFIEAMKFSTNYLWKYFIYKIVRKSSVYVELIDISLRTMDVNSLLEIK